MVYGVKQNYSAIKRELFWGFKCDNAEDWMNTLPLATAQPQSTEYTY